MTSSLVIKSVELSKPRQRRQWAPRMWEGCHLAAWVRLLTRNRFALHWSCWYIALIATVVTLFHTVLRFVQKAIYGRRIDRTPITRAPIFIIGHWRTGTTWLHELLILDRQFNFPTTYECFEPNHFLLTEWFMTRWLRFLLPSKRPMDNMAAGWDRPQEDEFAMCMLGQPSPYLTIAFPNRPPQCQEYFDLEKISRPALDDWKGAFLNFLRCLTFKDPRRLVLKSPPHSCRIKLLLEMFPDARFVHIVRDPQVVFPSTVNLWKALYAVHGLQRPRFEGLEEHVFATYTHIYDKIDEGRSLVRPGRFHELKYEDLVDDPVGEMRTLYEQLELDGFEETLPNLEKYLAQTRGYETNRYESSPECRAEVARRWGKYSARYGYDAT